MAVWNSRCSANGLDLGLELGSVGSGWDGPAEVWSGERVGVLGGVRAGELCEMGSCCWSEEVIG